MDTCETVFVTTL